MNWQEICSDPTLQELDYKIELNRWGNIVMTPRIPKHSFYLKEMKNVLQKSVLKKGIMAVECAIETQDGVKVADAAWISMKRMKQNHSRPTCSIAPEICIEIMGEGISLEEYDEKKKLFFAAGALEYWLCDKYGHMNFYQPESRVSTSGMIPMFPETIEWLANSH